MESVSIDCFDDEIKLTPEAEDVLQLFEETSDHAMFKRLSMFMDLGQLESENDKKKRLLLEKNLEAEAEYREKIGMRRVGESSLKIGESFAATHNEKITKEVLRIPDEINKQLMEEFEFISHRIQIRDLIENQALHKVLFQVPYILNITDVVRDFQLKNKPPKEPNPDKEIAVNLDDNEDINEMLKKLPSETTISERVGSFDPTTHSTNSDNLRPFEENSTEDEDEEESNLPQIRICSATNLLEPSSSKSQDRKDSDEPRINISTSIFENDSSGEEDSCPVISNVKSLNPSEAKNMNQPQDQKKRVFLVRRREPRQSLHGGMFEKIPDKSNVDKAELEVTKNGSMTIYKHKKPSGLSASDLVAQTRASAKRNLIISSNSSQMTQISSLIQSTAGAGGKVGQVVQIRPRHDGKPGKLVYLQKAPPPQNLLQKPTQMPPLIKMTTQTQALMAARGILPSEQNNSFRTPQIISSCSVAQPKNPTNIPSDENVNSPTNDSMAKAAMAEKASFPTRKIIDGVMYLGCRTCSKTFPASCETMYRNHMLIKHSIDMDGSENDLSSANSDTRWFRCKKCEQIFYSGFKAHHTVCSPEISFPDSFERIQMAMAQIGKIICGICRKAFSTRMSLRQHLTGFHKEVSNKVILDPMYRCSICLLRFEDSVDLLRHAVICMQITPQPRPSKATVLELAHGYLDCEVCDQKHESLVQSRECYVKTGLIRCPMCLHTIHIRGNFFTHLKVYHGRGETGSLQCLFCDDPTEFNIKNAFDHILNRHFSVELYNEALMKKVQREEVRNSAPISLQSKPRLVAIRPRPSSNASTSTSLPVGFTPMRLMPNLARPIIIEKNQSQDLDEPNSIRIVPFAQIGELGKHPKHPKTTMGPFSFNIDWDEEDDQNG